MKHEEIVLRPLPPRKSDNVEVANIDARVDVGGLALRNEVTRESAAEESDVHDFEH